MFIIMLMVMLSGLFIYVLLKPPHTQERSVRIARKAAVSEHKYELKVMSLNETQRSQE